MIEGWTHDNDYLVIFDPEEAERATVEYGIPAVFPGSMVAGLRGWDDLILFQQGERFFTVPTVPSDPKFLEPYLMPDPLRLADEPRLAGKVRWYVKPVIFGGDPEAEDNVAWVTHEKHRELCRWWNATYWKVKSEGA